MRFADVKNDIAFRKIFGDEKKKIILISFLNAIQQREGDARIKDISIGNPYQPPILPDFKSTILDVRARDYAGVTYIVEMQIANKGNMDKRALYYTSKEYSGQILEGEQYSELNPVIFIGVFNYPFSRGSDYLSHHAICNVKTGERIIKEVDFYFIELTKFQTPEAALTTVTEKWIYFLKEARNLAVIPENVDDEGLKEAYKYANRDTWTKTELDAYDNASIHRRDLENELEFAVKKATEEATEKAKKEGREEEKKEIAKALITAGADVQFIIKITGLSQQEIENL